MRVSLKTLAAAAAIVAAAACSDSSVAPNADASLRAADRAPTLDLITPGINLGSDFVLTSNGGTFGVAGMYTVNFPQDAVCDPSLTDYSAAEWDAPCQTLADGQSINVHATVKMTTSGVAVDFQPELQFSPSTTVTIWTDQYAATIGRNRAYYTANPTALGPLAMSYSTSLGGSRIADYTADSSVITHVNLITGRVWRRIKHFSGYNIFTGEKCAPMPDGSGSCVQADLDVSSSFTP